MGERIALIFGASGVSGWAVTRELLRYPTQTTFSRVIALSNRPLAREAVQLDDSRLELYSGVDLTKPVDVVVKSLREKVPGVDEVTHVYWYAYIHAPTDGDLVEVNGGLLDTTLHVLREAAPHMEHFLWQTGAKYYGVLFPETIPQVPLKESLPRRPEPEASSIFYYRQLDVIASHAKSARWKWNDVRPDAVVGYAPTTNAMNIALVLGVYLALYRAVYGRGASVPCPSNIAGARASNTESPADHLSRCAIWLSLRGDSSLSGQSFNVGVEPSTYAQRWALLADAWGLKGTEAQGEDTNYLRMGNDIAKWASEHATAWQKLEQDHGLKQGVLSATGFDFLGVMSIPTDRQLDTTAIEQAGWNEKGDALAAYKEAWARFAEAKFIPPV